ncbi:MAG: peptide/nickel transport system substrate-binding protein [Solirubrobacteraceae bacterium]
MKLEISGRSLRRYVSTSLAVTALVTMAVAGAGCGGGKSSERKDATTTISTAPASKGGTLKLARSIEPATFNPFTCPCDNGSWQTMVQVFDTLVEFMPGTTDAKPGLATGWDANSNHTQFTFHLRPAKFSDGTAVTSADVKYSLDRAKSPKATFYSLYSVIKSVSAPDASTVVVRLRAPTPNFPWYVGFPATSIVPRALIERLGDEQFGERPIGSGAFAIKRWVKGQVVELARNPHYWRKGQPYLDGVKMTYVPNDNTRVLALLSGDVDAVDAVPFSQGEQVDTSGKAKVLFQDSSAMYVVWLNQHHEPLDELVVRQALSYATPKEQLKQAVFHGKADVANANMPKLRDWSANVKAYPFDVEKAKQLMARSSKPNGFGLTISIVAGDQTTKQVAQVLQEAWRKIGVSVSVQQYDDATWATRRRNYQYQAAIPLVDVFTSDLPVQDEFAKLLFDNPETHNARTFWTDPAASQLVERAIHTPDASEQPALWEQLQKRTMENPSSVPLVFPPYRGAARSNVHGLQYVQVGWWRLEQASLKR